MIGLNKAMLIGRLGGDPELKYTSSGTLIVRFNIATPHTYKNKDGEKQEQTEWHRIVCFGKLAEICGEYLKKGSLVYLEGRIQTNEWEDKDGIKRKTTEIVGNTMQMLGGTGKRDSGEEKENVPEDDVPF